MSENFVEYLRVFEAIETCLDIQAYPEAKRLYDEQKEFLKTLRSPQECMVLEAIADCQEARRQLDLIPASRRDERACARGRLYGEIARLRQRLHDGESQQEGSEPPEHFVLCLAMNEVAICLTATRPHLAYAYAQEATRMADPARAKVGPGSNDPRSRLRILSLYNEGLALNHLHRLEEGIDAFRKARETMSEGSEDFTSAACLKFWADCLIELRRFTEGIQRLDLAVKAFGAVEKTSMAWDYRKVVPSPMRHHQLDVLALKLQALNELGLYHDAVSEWHEKRGTATDDPDPTDLQVGLYLWSRLMSEVVQARAARARCREGSCSKQVCPTKWKDASVETLRKIVENDEVPDMRRLMAQQELTELCRTALETCNQLRKTTGGPKADCGPCWIRQTADCQREARKLMKDWRETEGKGGEPGPRPIEEAARAYLCLYDAEGPPVSDECKQALELWREQTKAKPGWNWNAQDAEEKYQEFCCPWLEEAKRQLEGLPGQLFTPVDDRPHSDATGMLRDEGFATQLRANWLELDLLLSRPGHPSLRSRKRLEVAVLRRWNSYTPCLARAPVRSRGGGYFVLVPTETGQRRIGMVVDPGFQFLENFLDEGFCVEDIDVIIVTHAHPDHSAGLVACLNTLFELHKLPTKPLWREYCEHHHRTPPEPHRITLLLSSGVYTQYSNVLRDMTDVIHDIVRIQVPEKHEKGDTICVKLDRVDDCPKVSIETVSSPAPAIDGGGGEPASPLRLVFTRTFHTDLGAHDCLGFKLLCKGGNVGFTGDARWHPDLARFYEDCQLLIAHLGSFIKQKQLGNLETRHIALDLGDLFTSYNHLYMAGMGLMLQQYRSKNGKGPSPRIVVLSEFGEELKGNLRLSIVERLKNACGLEDCTVIAGDVGTRLSLRPDATAQATGGKPAPAITAEIRCAICNGYSVVAAPKEEEGNGKRRKDDPIAFGPEEALFYVCHTCRHRFSSHQIAARLEDLRTNGRPSRAPFLGGKELEPEPKPPGLDKSTKPPAP